MPATPDGRQSPRTCNANPLAYYERPMSPFREIWRAFVNETKGVSRIRVRGGSTVGR